MQGQDKGLVELNGKAMVEWALDRVTPQSDRVIINANRNLEAYQKFGVPVVTDQIEGHLGPLAGLYTALNFFDESEVFMCPCDSPFLPDVMVQRMLDAKQADNASIAVATDGDRLQPVFLLVSQAATASLESFLAAGERKIDRWFEREQVAEVSFADYPNAFRNINTFDELALVEQELGAGQH